MAGRHLLYTGTTGPGRPGYAKAVYDDMKMPRPEGPAQLVSMHFNSLRRAWDRLIDEGDPEALELLRRPRTKTPRHRADTEDDKEESWASARST